MKTSLALIFFLFLAGEILPQSIDFSTGSIQLLPDETFLPKADWNALFYDWETANKENGTGYHKDFAFGHDGRVIISNRSNYKVYILDKSGQLIKTFGKQGGKPGEFLFRQDFHGILDDQHLVFSDHQGRINFFNLDGNFVKMITIDFMPLNIYPDKGGKIILKGHVPMKTYSRKVLAVLDYNTEKYNIFYSYNESYDQPNRIIFPAKTGGTTSVGSGHTSRWITKVGNSGLVFSANNARPEIKLFTPQQGSYIESGFEVKVDPLPILQEDKDAYYENFKKRLKENGVDTVYAEKIRNDDFFPEHMPYYYNILVDESNNCMFFIYNNENKDYLFQAYTTTGKFLGQSEFVLEGYEILFQSNPVIIRDGYLYATALKKDAKNPLRIIKCKIGSERK